MMRGWGGFTFVEGFVCTVLTVLIQFCVIYFSLKFWKTRRRMWLIPLLGSILVSVSMSLGFYLDTLSLDKDHAAEVYGEEHDKAIGVINSAIRKYHDLAVHVDGLADYSGAMAEIERDEGGTCGGVAVIGRGPLALYRENDQENFMYHAKTFKGKGNHLDEIKTKLLNEFASYKADRIVHINDWLHRFNSVVEDNSDIVRFDVWLSKRVKHQPHKINCSDAKISEYHEFLKSNYIDQPFKTVLTIRIDDPDASATHIKQSFETILNLMTLNWDKIRRESWLALAFASFVDFAIFFLSYVPGSRTAQPSGSPPFSPLLRRLFEYHAGSRKQALQFLIPTNERDLVIYMLTWVAGGAARQKHIEGWWKVLLLVPSRLRRKASQQCHSFVKYEIAAADLLQGDLLQVDHAEADSSLKTPYPYLDQGSAESNKHTQTVPDSIISSENGPARSPKNGHSQAADSIFSARQSNDGRTT